MNKVYLTLLVVFAVAGGAWFVMKKSSSVPPPPPVPGVSNTFESTSGFESGQGDAQPTAGSQPVSVTNQITLTVTSPANNATVTSGTVTVRGKTVPNADVFVNDTETKADASGNFSAFVTLDEGENSIIIVANDANGNTAEQEIMVTSETY